jgi:uncharacterized membrane protein YeaQ/YmgE (transglycosylase-associated protein family)
MPSCGLRNDLLFFQSARREPLERQKGFKSFSMRKQYNIFHILKVTSNMDHTKRRGYYILVGSLGFCAGCLIFSAFAFLLTTCNIFAQLMYAVIGMIVVVAIGGIIWMVRGAFEKIKREIREEL